MTWQLLALIAVVAAAGAFVQSVVGLGMGLLAAPVVALVAPSLVPSLPLALALLISGAMVLMERSHIDWWAIGWSLPARIPGTVIGTWLVVQFTDRQIGLVLSVMVLLAVALTVRTYDVPVNPWTLSVAGLVAGASGTATSIGGPPIALLFQHRPPQVARATLSVFFCLGVVLSIGGLVVTHEMQRAAWEGMAVCAPGVFLGLLAGMRLRKRLPESSFRVGVLAICTVSALVLLGRSLVG